MDASTARKFHHASRRFLKLPILQHRRGASWGRSASLTQKSSVMTFPCRALYSICGVSRVGPVTSYEAPHADGITSMLQSSCQSAAHRVEQTPYSHASSPVRMYDFQQRLETHQACLSYACLSTICISSHQPSIWRFANHLNMHAVIRLLRCGWAAAHHFKALHVSAIFRVFRN